jgi:hypothetical protein
MGSRLTPFTSMQRFGSGKSLRNEREARMSIEDPRDRPLSKPSKLPLRALYDVGYAKPPREHQFRPGRSGNPRGRPKGAKNEATILRHLLNRKVAIRRGGRTRKLTVHEAIWLRKIEDALKGDIRSVVFVLNRYKGIDASDAQPIDDVSGDVYEEAMVDFAHRFLNGITHKRKRNIP